MPFKNSVFKNDDFFNLTYSVLFLLCLFLTHTSPFAFKIDKLRLKNETVSVKNANFFYLTKWLSKPVWLCLLTKHISVYFLWLFRTVSSGNIAQSSYQSDILSDVCLCRSIFNILCVYIYQQKIVFVYIFFNLNSVITL